MHPVTGDPLERNHVVNEPDVIRALNTAVGALLSEEVKIKRQQDLPERVGQPWSENEDNVLVTAFEKGMSLNDLAAEHQRTRGAIRARLVRLGKIDINDHTPR